MTRRDWVELYICAALAVRRGRVPLIDSPYIPESEPVELDGPLDVPVDFVRAVLEWK